MDFIIAPDFAVLGDVTGLGGVDARENADPLPVFGVLTDRDIDSILVIHRSRIDFTGAFSGGIFELFSLGWIAVELPDRLQETGLARFLRLGIERVTKAIAAPEEDQFF